MPKNNSEELVERLQRMGYLKTPRIIDAFRNVLREKFVPEKMKDDAYLDQPFPIGRGQTISAPSMIAIMLEVLQPREGDKVLEIGTGSGYNAALMAEIIGKSGELYTMERLKEISEFGRSNLEKIGYESINVITGDGTQGYEKEAPWDKILVTACAPKIPSALINQLKINGKIAAPVGQNYMAQTLTLVEKIGKDEVKKEKHGGCSFVPLIGENGWNEESVRR
ncbi:MAG: protein-L-isoaspartate(D-aspartate) O-methyltransferase [Hadesarchaea archaeon]|nr:protein-L-isoaspartate(D-aspartate) O-methyltransferase [Hadesarchaea archaeon]